MNEASYASVQRVLASIPEAQTRASVEALLKQVTVALHKLAGLDDTIYQCYKLDDAEGEFEAELDLTVTELRSRIFGGTKTLLLFLNDHGWATLGSSDDEEPDNGAFTIDFDVDDDLGDFGGFGEDFDAAFSETRVRSSPSLPSLPDLSEFDIDEAFDMLEPEPGLGTDELLAQLKDDIGPIAHAISDQVNTFEGRLRTAFNQGNYSLMIRELDAARESVREGLFAIANSIFMPFAQESVSLDFLPGYSDILEQALSVRKNIARMNRIVKKENDIVQSDEFTAAVRLQSIANVRSMLISFIESPNFHAMQAPDRWELVNFARSLKSSSFRKVCQACEGFAKYIESLGMVSPSELVVKHDQETIQGIHSILEAVRSLQMISPTGAKDMLFDALNQAQRLYGKDIYIDEQLDQWNDTPPNLDDPDVMNRVAERLTRLL